MQVFLSWSGDRSKAVAELLARRLRMMIQSLQLWHSEQIESGVRWSGEIAARLSSIDYGLVLVTPENQNSPWLLFEAGALAKSLDNARVVPLLIDFEHKTDVVGPLSQFQSRLIDRSDMEKLVIDLNIASGEEAVDREVLRGSFDAFWSETEQGLAEIVARGAPDRPTETRSVQDMLQEVLERLRDQDQYLRSTRLSTANELELEGFSTTSSGKDRIRHDIAAIVPFHTISMYRDTIRVRMDDDDVLTEQSISRLARLLKQSELAAIHIESPSEIVSIRRGGKVNRKAKFPKADEDGSAGP